MGYMVKKNNGFKHIMIFFYESQPTRVQDQVVYHNATTKLD